MSHDDLDSETTYVGLSRHVWKSVRYVLSYQIARLERKIGRTHSEKAAEYDRSRVANLTLAVSEISSAISDREE